MATLGFIVWDVDPVLFSLGPVTARWYGLMWGIGFLLGYELIRRIYRYEKCPDDWADKQFIYMAIGTILGARIGHCLFYGWDLNGHNFYLEHPTEMLKIWEGGLSSHGGAFGILIAMFLFKVFVCRKSYIWIFDRLVMPVAVCATCIRFGNLMNSEIYGAPTDLPWGFVFVRDYAFQVSHYGALQACHPTQIYEMIYCLVALSVCSWLYWRRKAGEREGLIFGSFLIIVFLTRFLLEFIKNDQEAFEQTMTLNMGQWLSIPFILLGLWMLFRAMRRHPEIE